MIPIIVVIPGFAGNLNGPRRQKSGPSTQAELEAQAVEDMKKLGMEMPPSSPWVPPPSDPQPELKWTTHESNEVYVAAIQVAQAIFDMHGQNDSTGVWDTSMRVLEKAREVATVKHLDHRQMIAGLTDVEQVIRQTIVEPWGDYAEGWWKAEAAQAGRLLWLATSVYAATAEMREQLQKIYGAPHDACRSPKSAREVAAELEEHIDRELAGLGPVNIVGDHAVVSIRPEGPEWAVPLADIPNPTKLLKYVSDLTSKTWCTREQVNKFVAAVCHAKGWEIYTFTPEARQA